MRTYPCSSSSNRTCGFPASGSPTVSRRKACTRSWRGSLPCLANPPDGSRLALRHSSYPGKEGDGQPTGSSRRPCVLQSCVELLQPNRRSLLGSKQDWSAAPSLHGHYPASSLLWAAPTPGRGRPVGYDFPTGVVPAHLDSDTTPGLPGSSTDLSTRALPNHPGQPGGCSRSLLPHR